MRVFHPQALADQRRSGGGESHAGEEAEALDTNGGGVGGGGDVAQRVHIAHDQEIGNPLHRAF